MVFYSLSFKLALIHSFASSCLVVTKTHTYVAFRELIFFFSLTWARFNFCSVILTITYVQYTQQLNEVCYSCTKLNKITHHNHDSGSRIALQRHGRSSCHHQWKRNLNRVYFVWTLFIYYICLVGWLTDWMDVVDGVWCFGFLQWDRLFLEIDGIESRPSFHNEYSHCDHKLIHTFIAHINALRCIMNHVVKSAVCFRFDSFFLSPVHLFLSLLPFLHLCQHK